MAAVRQSLLSRWGQYGRLIDQAQEVLSANTVEDAVRHRVVGRGSGQPVSSHIASISLGDMLVHEPVLERANGPFSGGDLPETGPVAPASRYFSPLATRHIPGRPP